MRYAIYFYAANNAESDNKQSLEERERERENTHKLCL